MNFTYLNVITIIILKITITIIMVTIIVIFFGYLVFSFALIFFHFICLLQRRMLTNACVIYFSMVNGQ